MENSVATQVVGRVVTREFLDEVLFVADSRKADYVKVLHRLALILGL